MDRGRSRSTPFLPRYQSVSPARSPVRLTSRSGQRILYINQSPSRVNVYQYHKSLSPRRTYKVHLLSTTSSQSLTRNSRSLSAYDLYSSHVYVSNEDLFDKSTRATATDRVASCEDIYHKASFFPDATPSESGVSFGESEEGSAFGVEDDNVSQHSFGSSSAFHEVTADSELDKCDSDNFSGPEGNAHRNDLTYRRDKRSRGRCESHIEPQSSDKNYISPFSHGESRKRELKSNPAYDLNNLENQRGVLSVHIPDSESPGEVISNSDKVGDRKVTSSVPLAHSTPHVSPGGSEGLKLNVANRWHVDYLFEETADNAKVTKPKALGPVFDFERNVRHSSRLEDSSYNSSCSEDNYSDVSNVTVSSPIPRKTKLVKKASDKPASSRSLGSYHTTKTSQKDVTPDTGESSVVLAELVNDDHSNQQTTLLPANVGHVQQVSKDSDWWTSYSSRSSTGQQADVVIDNKNNRERIFSYQQDDKAVKPLSVNIPLISAGKHGQEKLRQLSQTSPPLTKPDNRSPTRSPTEMTENEKTWSHLAHHKDQADLNRFKESLGHKHGGIMRSDNTENRHRYEDEVVEGKRKSPPPDTSRYLSRETLVGNETTSNNVNNGESPVIGKISQNEYCLESKEEARERVLTTKETEVMSCTVHETGGDFPRQWRNEGPQLTEGKGTETSISLPENFSCHLASPHEISDVALDGYTDITSSHKEILPVSNSFANAASVQGENSVAVEFVISPTVDENLTNLIINDYQAKRSRGTQRTADTSNVSFGVASLSQVGTQVAGLSHVDMAVFLSGESNTLMARAHGIEVEKVSKEITEEARVHSGDGFENSHFESQNTIDDNDLEESGSHGNHSESEQEVFDVRICPENDVCSIDLDSASVVNTHAVNVNGDKLFLDNAASEIVVDSGFESSVTEQDEQKVSTSFQETPVDLSSVTELKNMEKHSEARTTRMGEMGSPSECWESPQTMKIVVAPDGECNINSNISTHENASMSHAFPLMLEKADIITDVNLVTHSHKRDDSFDGGLAGSVIENNAAVDKPKLAFLQKDILGLGIPGSAFGESIKAQDDLELVINKQMSRDEQLWPEKQEAIVESREGFMQCSGTEEKVATVTDIPSRSIEHVSCPAEQKTANSLQANHFLQKLDSAVVIVKDKSVTENIVKEGEYSTAIERNILDADADVERCESSSVVDVTHKSGRRTEHVSCPVDEKTVNSVQIHHYPRNVDSTASDIVKEQSCTENKVVNKREYSTAPARKTLDTDTVADVREHSLIVDSKQNFFEISETEEPGVIYQEGTDDLLHTTPSSVFSSSISVMMPTPRLTVYTSAPTVHTAKVQSKDLNKGDNKTGRDFTDNIYTSVVRVADIKDQKHVDQQTNTSQAAMDVTSPLDNLQTQLSLISGSPQHPQLAAACGSVANDDHTRAASVMKEIVRGNVIDFVRFSDTRDQKDDERYFGKVSVKESRIISVSGELSKPLVEEADGGGGTCVVREHYDNDYDNVTTELQNGTKLFTIPQRQHHLKPSNAKSSSLWTLQEETGISSPKLPRAHLYSEKDSMDNKLVDHLSCIPEKPITASASSQVIPSGHVEQKQILCKEVNHTVSSDFSVQKYLTKEDSGNADAKQTTENFTQATVFGNKTRASDSSGINVKAGNASSVNTKNNSHSSSSFEKEQIIVSKPGSCEVTHGTDILSHEGHSQMSGVSPADVSCELSAGSKPLNITISWPDDSHTSITGIRSIRNISSRSQQRDESYDATFWSSHVFSLRRPEDKDAEGYISPLDKLHDSLQQFGAIYSENGEWKPLQAVATESHESYSANTSATDGHRSSNDNVDGEKHRSCVSDDKNPTSADWSSGSRYKSSGSAQVVSSYHYNIPAYIPKNIATPTAKTAVVINDGRLHDKKIGEFDKILDQFSKDTRPGKVSSHTVFISGQNADSSGSCESSSEDLYNAFTSEHSEKNQSHTCVVVEDENMNTFRFKRYLKKSHTKRNKGEKVMRFISKLVCVSETGLSSVSGSHQRVKPTQTFSTDSMPSSRLNISSPVLVSSTSFYHHDVSSLRPLVNVNGSSAPISSSHSLDSLRSRGDSAYSSISESTAGSVSTPTSRNFSRTSHAALLGSASSGFCSGSTSDDWSFSDSVFPSSPNTTFRVSYSEPSHLGESDGNKMSSLPDVFDKLNAREEIDGALLNRLQYGHSPAEVKIKRNDALNN